MEIRRIGDELDFDGQVCAILAQSGVSPTIMDHFLGSFGEVSREACIEDILEECSCKHIKECPLHKAENGTTRSELEEEDRDRLLAELTARARNGLLRLSDACDIVNRLLDDEL